MVRLISAAKKIQAAGSRPKTIEEFVGRVNTGTSDVSIARMVSPEGWEEPGQTPAFDEYSVVLEGALQVRTRDVVHKVHAGQAVLVEKGTRVRYSTPDKGGAVYLAICMPAFSPETVHRDEH